jgi:hypothetical protein
MKSSKRLATLSLIIMALVSTPRAVQQLRYSINAAQERAGLVWWNLLLTPEAHAAAESTVARTNGCPQSVLAGMIRSNNSTPARSNAKPAAAVRFRSDARTTQRQSSSDFDAGPELASNNYSPNKDSPNKDSPNNYSTERAFAPATLSNGPDPSSERAAAQGRTPQKLASHARPQASPTRTPAKIQSALASLDEHNAEGTPPNIQILRDMDVNEFAASPSVNALMEALAKKGLNVQFRMKKVLDRNQLPRPKARALVSRDGNPLPRGTRCECPSS